MHSIPTQLFCPSKLRLHFKLNDIAKQYIAGGCGDRCKCIEHQFKSSRWRCHSRGYMINNHNKCQPMHTRCLPHIGYVILLIWTFQLKVSHYACRAGFVKKCQRITNQLEKLQLVNGRCDNAVFPHWNGGSGALFSMNIILTLIWH